MSPYEINVEIDGQGWQAPEVIYSRLLAVSRARSLILTYGVINVEVVQDGEVIAAWDDTQGWEEFA